MTPETGIPRIQQVLTHFQRLHLPFLWHVGPSSSLPANLEHLLIQQGFLLAYDEPGMAADLATLPASPPPLLSGFDLRPVLTKEDLVTWESFWSDPQTPQDAVQMSIAAEVGLGICTGSSCSSFSRFRE